jgi:hypothetical protein
LLRCVMKNCLRRAMRSESGHAFFVPVACLSRPILCWPFPDTERHLFKRDEKMVGATGIEPVTPAV